MLSIHSTASLPLSVGCCIVAVTAVDAVQQWLLTIHTQHKDSVPTVLTLALLYTLL
jgi:hypothetical protein